jgi:hypothetical protein
MLLVHLHLHLKQHQGFRDIKGDMGEALTQPWVLKGPRHSSARASDIFSKHHSGFHFRLFAEASRTQDINGDVARSFDSTVGAELWLYRGC